MSQYSYRPSVFGNKLVLQREVINPFGRNRGVDVNLMELPSAHITPTHRLKEGASVLYWRLRRGWCKTLVLQLSKYGTSWEDARLQDLSMSTTLPVPK